MNGCNIDKCSGDHYAHGWCNMHYTRWKRYGDPETVRLVKYTSPDEAFEARTEWREGCLVWTGAKNPNGYGQLRIQNKLILAHRYAYIREKGSIEPGLVVDHTCYNPACCNVAHLALVTTKQNTENPSKPKKNNTSRYPNVTWNKRKHRWAVGVMHQRKHVGGGYFMPYELHVAAYYARKLRNSLHTNNLQDKGLTP